MGEVENHMINTLGMASKARAFVELLKLRLSLLVAFSSVFGYILATNGQLNWGNLLLLSLGGTLVSGASVSITHPNNGGNAPGIAPINTAIGPTLFMGVYTKLYNIKDIKDSRTVNGFVARWRI